MMQLHICKYYAETLIKEKYVYLIPHISAGIEENPLLFFFMILKFYGTICPHPTSSNVHSDIFENTDFNV